MSSNFPISRDVFSYMVSYLPVKDAFNLSSLNKECRAWVCKALFEQIKSFNKIALSQEIKKEIEEITDPTPREVMSLAKRIWFMVAPHIFSEHRRMRTQIARADPMTRPYQNNHIQLSFSYERTRKVRIDWELDLVFKRLPLAEGERPCFKGTVLERASAIRKWMKENSTILDQVTSLDISYLKLTEVPPELMLCKNLESLSLRGNGITCLPENFEFPGLSRLELVGMAITHLPEKLSLLCPKLRQLELTYSPISHLPKKFEFPMLEELLLDCTLITCLPEEFCCPKLKQLWLTASPITHFPKNFHLPALEELGIKNTKIQRLPKDAKFPMLRELTANS